MQLAWSHSARLHNGSGSNNNKLNKNENTNNIITNNIENSICRLDRKESAQLNRCRSRCNWKSYLASIIIVLLHLASTIECLQPRQEGMYKFHAILFNNNFKFVAIILQRRVLIIVKKNTQYSFSFHKTREHIFATRLNYNYIKQK